MVKKSSPNINQSDTLTSNSYLILCAGISTVTEVSKIPNLA